MYVYFGYQNVAYITSDIYYQDTGKYSHSAGDWNS